MIKLQGTLNCARVEEFMKWVVNSPDNDLQIPVAPQEWWLGGELSLIELLITWARVSSSPTLHTHIPVDEDPNVQLEKMARRMFGFVALMMAKEIRGRDALLSPSPGSLRAPAYEQCRRVVEMMYQPIGNFALGSKVFLISVDQSTKANIPWLYAPDGTIADRQAFISLAKDLFKKTNLTFSATPQLQLSAERIGAVLHELFKNTDDWATRDGNNVPWRRSVRGLSAEYHTKDVAELNGIASANPALARYFAKLKERTSGNRLAFLELSVFDSGIGLARQMGKVPTLQGLSLSEEYKHCMNCLTLHQTSSNRRDKGLGLAEVMEVLSSLDGLLKLRTGRLSLFRDFVHAPHRPTPEDVHLDDFPTCTATLSEQAAVYGTHYQMLIPIH